DYAGDYLDVLNAGQAMRVQQFFDELSESLAPEISIMSGGADQTLTSHVKGKRLPQAVKRGFQRLAKGIPIGIAAAHVLLALLTHGSPELWMRPQVVERRREFLESGDRLAPCRLANVRGQHGTAAVGNDRRALRPRFKCHEG